MEGRAIQHSPSPAQALASRLLAHGEPLLLAVTGAPGSGKSALAVQIALAILEAGQPVLHVTSRESPAHTDGRYQAIWKSIAGPKTRPPWLVEPGRLYVHRYPSWENALAGLADLLAVVRGTGIHPALLVCDGPATPSGTAQVLADLVRRERLHGLVCLDEHPAQAADLHLSIQPSATEARVTCTTGLPWNIEAFRLERPSGRAVW